MEEITIPRTEAPAGSDLSDGSVQRFSEEAFDEILSHLEQNRQEYERMQSDQLNAASLDEVVAAHNTRSLDIRAKPLENPKVTLWLKDCPIWANDSWRTHINPEGINSYNGKVDVVFDVRPF